MSLVLCPECQAEISNKAASCPQCGHPFTGEVNLPAHRPAKPPRQKSYISPRFALAATGVLAMTGLFAMIGSEEEGMAILAGFTAWACAIPIWWKARRAARARAMPGAAEIDRQIAERLREVEERFRHQLAQVEDSGRLMMDMEERMEFMERLLTKYRDDQLNP